MSKYSGLDKISKQEITDQSLCFIETYRGIKIYLCADDTYIVISRGWLVDECINDIQDARSCIDHFKQD